MNVRGMIGVTHLEGVGVSWGKVEVAAAVLQCEAAAFWDGWSAAGLSDTWSLWANRRASNSRCFTVYTVSHCKLRSCACLFMLLC